MQKTLNIYQNLFKRKLHLRLISVYTRNHFQVRSKEFFRFALVVIIGHFFVLSIPLPFFLRALAHEKIFIAEGMDLKFGIYEHYKGKKHRVIGVAKHSETLKDMVVYEALYKNELSKLWTRPLAMFLGEVEVAGKRVLRFKYLGESGADF